MTPYEYQNWVAHNWEQSRGPDDGGETVDELRELFIMSVGLGGEAGEVQELLKKFVRDGREIRDDLVLELGDVIHYVARIASEFGIQLHEVLVTNRSKIEARNARRLQEASAPHG